MTDVDDFPAVQAVSEQSGSKSLAGAKLAEARVAQGFSLEQIAAYLKWTPRQITEIEAGNYTVFSDMASVRGFVRSYAKYLKVDPTPLLVELADAAQKNPAKVVDRPQLDMPFSNGRLPWLGKPHHNTQKIVALLSLALLCLVALFVYRADLMAVARSVWPTTTPKPLGSQPVLPVKSEIPLSAQTVVSMNAPTPTPTQVPQSAPVTPAAALVAAAPATKASPAQVAPHGAAAPVAANPLVLSFKQDSWLQIRRSNGSILVAKLFRAGAQESIDVSEPLALVIGNAPGVDARLRGELLALPAQPGSNVVTVNIK